MHLTVKEFAKKCEELKCWPHSESAIRKIIYDSTLGLNNFSSAIIKGGKRILIDEEKFWKILKSQK